MKNKEINNKLKLEDINWFEVVNILEPKIEFRNCDIKQALKKTGRNFNTNAVFYAVVRNFISFLGDRVKVELKNGEKYYTLLEQIKAPEKKKREPEPILIRSTLFDSDDEEENVTEEITKEIVQQPVGRIPGGTKRVISLIIKTLAVFLKYDKSEVVPGKTLAKELETLNESWLQFRGYRSVIGRILETLGLPVILCTRHGGSPGGHDSAWKYNGDTLEAFMRLQDYYKSRFGEQHENLDDYISSKNMITVEEKYQEIVEELKEKEQPKIFERNESTEIKWKKFLLLEALKAKGGTENSIKSLTKWIETTRYEEISENEALSFIKELQQDSKCFKFGSGYCISFKNNEILTTLFKLYDPKKITETVYVKVKLTPQEMNTNFPGLMFGIDETLEGGKYIYKITLDRSYKMENYLKKLMRIIKISGSIYNTSFMVTRVSKIIKQEDCKMYPSVQELLSLEDF